MARKSLDALNRLDMFEEVSAVKYDLAHEVYDAQDDETKMLIDKIEHTLRQYATATVKIGKRNWDITEEQLHFNLFYLAVEVVKDLALLDIRVGNFTFPEDVCATCGGEVDG